jgi:signal-transduction protein with cAMP-binding, CBS, and nucleotidyltransferase domain
LLEYVHALLAGHTGFLQLLANDCLANLPPLTFYKGLVVEDGGASSENLDLRQAVILPLVDTARVFGLRWGQREPGTWERFAAAERREQGQERLFAAAREAYRIASAHRGRLGLAAGDAGSLINPSS